MYEGLGVTANCYPSMLPLLGQGLQSLHMNVWTSSLHQNSRHIKSREEAQRKDKMAELALVALESEIGVEKCHLTQQMRSCCD